MSERSEWGLEERPLTESEWQELAKVFSRGKGSIGVIAFRRHNCCLRDEDLTSGESYVTNIGGIQAAMNLKLSSMKMPFKVIFRCDGRIPRPLGPSYTLDPINPRIVLMCKEAVTR